MFFPVTGLILRRGLFRGNRHMLSTFSLSEEFDDIQKAEEILWKKLVGNAVVLNDVESRKLKNEESLPGMRKLLSYVDINVSHLNALKIIHITGSKGKGTTAAMVESILRNHGLRTALFTSPHLVHPRERLRINGKSLSLNEFSQSVIHLYERLSKSVDKTLGFSRFLTVLAFEKMIELCNTGLLDVAIIEVGMGGRYDTTNVVENPLVTAVTSLEMEHVRALGPTLKDIAYHKVGVAKSNIPFLIPPVLNSDSTQIEAYDVMKSYCKDINAPYICVLNSSWHHNLLQINRDIELSHPDYWFWNAVLAANICEKWLENANSLISLNVKTVRSAILLSRWPGRQEIYSDGKNVWFLDGAHTLLSISYTVKWLELQRQTSKYFNCPNILAFHCTHDRDFATLLDPILKYHKEVNPFTSVFFVRPQSPYDPDGPLDLSFHNRMADYWNSLGIGINATSVTSSLFFEWASHQHDSSITVLGSLYLVGDFMAKLQIDIP